MVGAKLISLLEKEVNNYLRIPYLYGGKNTWEEIKKNFSEYKQLKKNKQGIDCSGLAYHLLDYYSKLLGLGSIYGHLIGTEGKRGASRVSANLFTSPPNSFPLYTYSDIRTGDLIRLDSGRHILFVLEYKKSQIRYVHSSHKTKTRGVHLGEIQIVDPSKTLDHQKWNETYSNGKNYSSIFNQKNGDGIFRLFLFKQL
ncbi:MAG: hypothetical protein WC841_01945 [Candidatus Shapirobacteria bacterium]|jgi:hypothetical protein